MSSKHTVKSRALRCVALFVGTLVVLIALVAVAQHAGSVRAAGSSSAPAESRTVDASRPATNGSLLRSVQTTGRGSGNNDRHGFGIRAMNSDDSLYLPQVFYGSGGSAYMSVAVADLNGDGKPDLLAANQCGVGICDQGGQYAEGTLGVLLGTGGGKFGQAAIYDSGGCNSSFLAVGDFNGDGKPDVAVLNQFSGPVCTGPSLVGIFLGKGDGTFQPLAPFPGGDAVSYAITVADVNRDGKPDLAVGAGGSLGILLGNGDGTFQPSTDYSLFGTPSSIVVTDLNGDGEPDLAVSTFASVSVLLGNGDGTFRTPVAYDSGGFQTYSVAVGDVNGDGKLDLVSGNYCTPGCFGNSVVGVLLGNGDGTFQPTVVLDSGEPFTTWLALADVNEDGKLDILVPSLSDVTGLLLGNGDGTFQSPSTLNLSAFRLAVADVNHDGKPDLLAATRSSYIGVSLHIGLATRTVVTTSGSPSQVGQSVTFTAAVTSRFGLIPDGELMTFADGKTTLASVPVAGGTAAFTTSSLSGKTHTIKATYVGDAKFKSSTGVVTQVVEKYETTTTLTSNPNPSQFGQAVTFTATVTSTGPPPTGYVRFWEGNTALGSVKLNAGVAKLTKSTLAVGTNSIFAAYVGNATSHKSASNVVDQVVH